MKILYLEKYGEYLDFVLETGTNKLLVDIK